MSVPRSPVGRRGAVLRNRTTSSVFLRFFAICSAQARPSSLQRGPRQPAPRGLREGNEETCGSGHCTACTALTPLALIQPRNSVYTYVLHVSIGPRAETKPAAPFTLLVLWFYRRGRKGHAVYTILYSGLKPAALARLPPTGLAQDLQNLAVAVLGGHEGGRDATVIGCPQVGPCLARGCSLHIQGVEAGPRLLGLRK